MKSKLRQDNELLPEVMKWTKRLERNEIDPEKVFTPRHGTKKKQSTLNIRELL